MILYFSASGNSRFIAEHAAALLEDEACSLNARIRLDQHDPLESARPHVLVCPTYAWRIPRIVEEHLCHTELKGRFAALWNKMGEIYHGFRQKLLQSRQELLHRQKQTQMR